MSDLLISFVDVLNEFIEMKKTHSKLHEMYYQKIALINDSGCSSMSLLLQLIEKYDISKSVCWSSLKFFAEPLQNDIHEQWIAFGEYPGYGSIYVLDTKNDEIICVDIESNTIDWYCAKNEESFLLNLIEILKIEIRYVKNQKVPDSLLAETYTNCVQVAGGEKYKTYYQYVLGYGMFDNEYL